MDNDDQETENPGGGITNGANGANGQYQEQQVIHLSLFTEFAPFIQSVFLEATNPFLARVPSLSSVVVFIRLSRARGSDRKCWRNESGNRELY